MWRTSGVASGVVLAAVCLAGCGGEVEPAALAAPIATTVGLPTRAATHPPVPSATPLAPTGIPRVAAIYDVVITGHTAIGDTPSTSPETVYAPVEQFTIEAILVVEPTLPAPQGNVSNGPNSREFALFAGSVTGMPVAGAIWFASNTIMIEEGGYAPVHDTLDAMDVAFVNAYDAENRVDVEADAGFAVQPAARTTAVNTFAWRTGGGDAPNLIIAGGLKLFFAPDGESVTGEVYVLGIGQVEPGTYLMDGTFSGRRR